MPAFASSQEDSAVGGQEVESSRKLHETSPQLQQSPYVSVASGSRHSIGVASDGSVYSWGRSNAVGQLGRESTIGKPAMKPGIVPIPTKVARAFCSQGCSSGAGHSALLDYDGRLWMAGCDRWQQLGLGSANGGSSGYTWIDGKLWQDRFVLSESVLDLMQSKSSEKTKIRDVALGGDHTLVLASNQKDVFAFGKGGDGQLGLMGRSFVSAPVKSKTLSEDGNGVLLSSVCAIQKCSLTLDTKGSIRNKVGRCKTNTVEKGIQTCIAKAKGEGLIEDSNPNP